MEERKREMFILTYGEIVMQLLRDNSNDEEKVNKELDEMYVLSHS